MKKTIFKSVGFTCGVYLTLFITMFLIPWKGHQDVIRLGLLAFFLLSFLPTYFFLKSGDGHPWWYMAFVLIADIVCVGALFHMIPLFGDGWDAVGYALVLAALQYYFAMILLGDLIVTVIVTAKDRKKRI